MKYLTFNMKTLGILLAAALIIGLSIYFTKKDSRRIKQLHEEFKAVQIEHEINSRITRLYTEKGACFVTLGSNKYFFSAFPSGSYEERYLTRVLEVGDSITKRIDSDTLKIYKANKEYSFKLVRVKK